MLQLILPQFKNHTTKCRLAYCLMSAKLFSLDKDQDQSQNLIQHQMF